LKRFLLLGWLSLAAVAGAGVSQGVDPQTGLKNWTWRGEGVSVKIVQRLPDQTRGFFLGRGFSAVAADRIATTCIMQTIFRNDGVRPVTYDLNDWRVIHRDVESGLLTREYWDRQWTSGGPSRAARIALRWSLLPSRQTFQPGDYNWGMSSYALPPGSRFDLHIVVDVGGRRIEQDIPSIECAIDRTEK